MKSKKIGFLICVFLYGGMVVANEDRIKAHVSMSAEVKRLLEEADKKVIGEELKVLRNRFSLLPQRERALRKIRLHIRNCPRSKVILRDLGGFLILSRLREALEDKHLSSKKEEYLKSLTGVFIEMLAGVPRTQHLYRVKADVPDVLVLLEAYGRRNEVLETDFQRVLLSRLRHLIDLDEIKKNKVREMGGVPLLGRLLELSCENKDKESLNRQRVLIGLIRVLLTDSPESVREFQKTGAEKFLKPFLKSREKTLRLSTEKIFSEFKKNTKIKKTKTRKKRRKKEEPPKSWNEFWERVAVDLGLKEKPIKPVILKAFSNYKNPFKGRGLREEASH